MRLPAIISACLYMFFLLLPWTQCRHVKSWRNVACPSRMCKCLKRQDGVHLRCGRKAFNSHFKPSNMTISSVSLAYKNLTILEPYAFRAIPMRHLDLRGNSFPQALPDMVFGGLEKTLTSLLIGDCGLRQVPQRSIANLKHLTSLCMEDNYIQIIHVKSFEGLTHLRDLLLYRNEIYRIQTGSFYGLGNLENLQLFDNNLRSLGRRQFKGLKNLTSLDLSRNSLVRLKGGTFHDLRKLVWLELGFNRLNHLSRNTFKGLSRLRYLSLGHNPLMSIADGTFLSTRRLSQLFLDATNVPDLINTTFQGLSRLERLFFGEMGRTTLPKGVFQHLEHLRYFAFTDYGRLFKGLTTKMFARQFQFKTLSVWSEPIHACRCTARWVSRLTARGAYIHGYCPGRNNIATRGPPLSCKRHNLGRHRKPKKTENIGHIWLS